MDPKVLGSINIPPWPITVAITALVLAVIINYFTKDKKLPPGPKGLPYFGYLPFLKKERLHVQLEELGKKYGDLFSFTSTGLLFLHLGSHKALREVLVSKSDCFEIKAKFDGILFDEGLFFVDGECWRILRRFYTQYLKECGFSSVKDEKAGAFYDSTHAIISDLKASKGKPFNITDDMMNRSTYIMRKILFGEYGMSNDELRDFNQVYEELFSGLTDMRFFLCSSTIRSLLTFRNHVFNNALRSYRKLQDVLLKIIRRHEETLDENHVRDVVDAFLMERVIRKRKDDGTAEFFTDKGFVATLIQIVGDGIVSVALFTSGFIKVLLDRPEEQEKIYKELVNVIGTDRQTTLEDRSSLPYTNSFIYETMRTSEFFPLFPSVQCTRRTTLRDYRIPKNTVALINFWAVNHNPNTYEDPYEFKPSRFITVPGKPKPELPVIFGMGKRACIGEYFTMVQAFLFLTTIVKNFKLSYPPEGKKEDPVFFTEGKIYAIAEPRVIFQQIKESKMVPDISIDSPVSVAVAGIAVLLAITYFTLKEADILPGPSGFPYFGLLPFLDDKTCHVKMQDMAKKYGDLFSFKFAGTLYICMNSAKAMREVHVTKWDCFSERSTRFSIVAALLGEGVAGVNGEAWKTLRKFFIQSLKEYGMKENMGPVYNSLSDTMDYLRSKNGDPANVLQLLTDKCTVTIRSVLFGENGISQESIESVNDALSVVLGGLTSTKLMLYGISARFICTFSTKYRNILKRNEELTNILLDTVAKIEKKMDEGCPTCVVEDYLKERNKRRFKKDQSADYFSDRALVSSLSQFIGDGILSTAFLIGAALETLLQYPEEQDKIYREALEVIGKDRLPTVEDKSRMPYTNAVLQEVERMANIVPLFPSVTCIKETTIRGYKIPKGAMTLLNFWTIHRDPNTYENPDEFNPSRFLLIPGKSKAESPVTFGIGKRACIGEALVKTQIFLYITSIVKNFHLSATQAGTTSLMEGTLEICFLPRNSQ
ncbi:uncharacterized protein LOC129220883 [Uloborus diversus]|uniref:uncharacterized protein LOC129220883 n=1 Tax=Uloborus diversus TaxID=327109 RepID=UPI00240A7382|nr:uncharacterized protein LOC129220883 [Uloborus diversus]